MTRRDLILPALGTGIVAMVAGGLAQRIPGDAGSMDLDRTISYVAFAGAAAVFYAGAVWRVRRTAGSALPVVLVLAVAMRMLTFASPPLLSTDIYRYVWDGKVQAAGINPYLHLPAAPELQGLRDGGTGAAAVYPNINRAYYAPTIYPPVAQALFALVGLTWPTIWGMKAAMLAFDLLGIGAALALLRLARQPAERVLILAWNPLIVWEFAGGGHIDAAALGFVGLTVVLAARRHRALAGLALGAAVLCKLLPAALFPAVWRRWDVRTPLAAGALIAGSYACYAGAGWRVLGYLPGYASEEGLGGGGFLLLRLAAAAGDVAVLGWPCLCRHCWDRAAGAGGAGCLPRPAAGGAWGSRRCDLPGCGLAGAGGDVRIVAALPLVSYGACAAMRPGAVAACPVVDGGGAAALSGPWTGEGGCACLGVPARRGLDCLRPVPTPDAPWRAFSLRRLPMSATLDARPSAPDPRRYFEAVPAGDSVAGALPVCLYLEVTNRCNLLCETCPRTFEALEPPADMSMELFRRIVDQVPGVSRVVLHGVGEPMLVRHLPDMIRYLKQPGRQTHVLFNTNGTLLAPKRHREIMDTGLDELRVSLDAAEAATFLRVRGKDMFDRIVRNVSAFTNLQAALGRTEPVVSLWLTGLKETVDQLPAFVRLAAGIGVREVHLQRLVFDEAGFGLARPDSSLFERTRAGGGGRHRRGAGHRARAGRHAWTRRGRPSLA